MSEGRCQQFDRRPMEGGAAGEEESRWREHLAGCADCREQAVAAALLGEALGDVAPPTELSAEFEGRLRHRLERRAAGSLPAPRRPARLRSAGLWALAAYATAATAATAVILARLPWQSLTPSPVLLVCLGGLAMLSPLVLLDRIGIVRPPG